jgi:ubiquinone/menaquinone biosynthesis C-methylase UbiE
MIYQNPDPCLAEVKRVLKDDGVVSAIDPLSIPITK